MTRPTLLIVIASTRPGRVGLPVARWFEGHARDEGSFEVQVADLAELDLPMFNEPRHPRLGGYTHEHTRRWSAVVAPADAFVFVVPEYNFGFNAAVKNALDYLNAEWRDKAVGFVSYGGVAAGTRAVQMLKQVVTALKMVPLFEAVSIPFVTQFLDDQGTLRPNDVMTTAASAMLAELARVNAGLARLRDAG